MRHTTLLVDDDQNVLHGLARSLHQQPYAIQTARSAEEAMSIIKAHQVNVLVVDEKMPGMSGSDLLAWVTKNYPEVMRIMLTGHATTSTVIRAINEGAVYYFLTKPCDEVQLAIAIRKALEHSSLVQENQRLLEQNRCQAEKLKCLCQDLEILTRILTRDLQQPLRKILDSCQLLEEHYGDVFDLKARELIDNSLDAAAEAQRLICNLLEHFHAETPASILAPCCLNREEGDAALAAGKVHLEQGQIRESS